MIDLDDIKSEIHGTPKHQMIAWSNLAMRERNRVLGLLAETNRPHVWFIIGAPRSSERNWWCDKLGCGCVVLETALDECYRRIDADITRRGVNRAHKSWAKRWWSQYTRRHGDTVERQG